MQTIFYNIILSVVIFLSGLGFFFFYMRKKGIDHIKRYNITSTYFVLLSGVSITGFKKFLLPLVENFTYKPFIPLVLISFINILFYYAVNKHINYKKQFEQYNENFLKINFRYLVTKPLEILFQQIFVVTIVVMLNKIGISILSIMLIFAVVFGLSHLLLFSACGKFFTLYYTIFSVGSSLIFPYLILKIHYGFVYTYTIHYLFYTCSGIAFFLLGKQNEKAF